MKHIGWKIMVAALTLVSEVSCIDEDLSDCGREYSVQYDVNLVTNLETELETELETIEETELGKRLKEALANVFTDQARDIDLRFYGTDSLLCYSEQHVINSNNASYTIYLPIQNYMHLALANDDQEKNIILENDGYAQHLAWKQVVKDTIDSYENGLFSARLGMEVKDVDSHFEVRMYMQNSAVALVLHTNNVKTKSIKGVLAYLADGFTVRDSIYSYHDDILVRTKELEHDIPNLRCLYGVGFPSRDMARIPTRAPKSEAEEGTIWELRAYVTLEDGKTTETILHVKEPLKAGNLKVINAELLSDGSISTDDTSIGASVELDWEDGGEYNPEI